MPGHDRSVLASGSGGMGGVTPGALRHPRRLARASVLLAALSLLVVGCGGEASGPSTGPDVTAPAPSPSGLFLATPRVEPSLDTAGQVCARLAVVEERTAALRAVELRLPNRVALDIELGKLQAAVAELTAVELGGLEERLEEPLTRLGYRLGEVELAVEDFRTNSRPQRAAPHVEADTQTFADELGAFAILARC
jgi:hypothetical protein